MVDQLDALGAVDPDILGILDQIAPIPEAPVVEPEMTTGQRVLEALINIAPTAVAATQGGSVLENVAGFQAEQFARKAQEQEALEQAQRLQAQKAAAEASKFRRETGVELIGEQIKQKTQAEQFKTEEAIKQAGRIELQERREEAAMAREAFKAENNPNVAKHLNSKQKEEIATIEATMSMLDQIEADIDALDPNRLTVGEGPGARVALTLARMTDITKEGQIEKDLKAVATQVAKIHQDGRLSDFDFKTFMELVGGGPFTSIGDLKTRIGRVKRNMRIYTNSKLLALKELAESPEKFVDPVKEAALKNQLPVLDVRVFGQQGLAEEMRKFDPGSRFVLRQADGLYRRFKVVMQDGKLGVVPDRGN